jgi:hypothetical protein
MLLSPLMMIDEADSGVGQGWFLQLQQGRTWELVVVRH